MTRGTCSSSDFLSSCHAMGPGESSAAAGKLWRQIRIFRGKIKPRKQTLLSCQISAPPERAPSAAFALPFPFSSRKRELAVVRCICRGKEKMLFSLQEGKLILCFF